MQVIKRSAVKGMPPGSLVYIGREHDRKPTVSVIDYDQEQFTFRELPYRSEEFGERQSGQIRWVRVQGVHDVAVIERVCRMFKVHPLTIEDILHTDQRSKLEEFDDYTFLEFEHLDYDPESATIQSVQAAIVIGTDFILSFEEAGSDIFQAIVERLRKKKGRVRGQGSHYLAYVLLDVVVDHYFVAADSLREGILAAETDLLAENSPDILESLYALRRAITIFRSKLLPVADMATRLRRPELFGKHNQMYLRELSEHIVNVSEIVRSLGETVGDMLDLFMARASFRMNEIMKTLTIVGAIFIPLTFVVGIFGMNFDYMPELRLPWAYPATLCLLGGIAAGMIAYFRRKQWL